MRQNNISRLIFLGTIIATGLSASLETAQAQTNAQPQTRTNNAARGRGGRRNGPIGTPVSPDYKGLRTEKEYQPLAYNGVTPPPVHVVPINDDLRSSYNIDPFYKKTLTSAGVVIVGSDRVSDWAFLEAAYTLDHQLHESPTWVRDALTTNKVRLAIIADVEYTMDLPENNRNNRNSSIDQGSFQDTRSRGLGGMPDCSCAEENLLNLNGDHYGGNGSPTAGENITIHEFSHTVASAIGSRRSQGRNGEFWTRLNKAFADGNAPGGRLAVWNSEHSGRGKVYASTDTQEYWAEGAQAWFDHANPGNSGGITTRDEVKQKDPELAALLAEVYGDGPWKYHKTTAKNDDGTTMRSASELAHLDGLEAVRGQFPRFNFNNSPRVIAQMKAQAAQSNTNTPAEPIKP